MFVLLMTFFGGSVFLTLWILSKWYQRTYAPSSHPSLVRAFGYPIIGSLLDFLPGSIIQTSRQWPVMYGPFVEYYIFNKRSILISDPVIAKEILSKRPKKFQRLRSLALAQKNLRVDKGLFQSNGDQWKRIRKATAPSFNQFNVISKLPGIFEELFAWIDRLEQEITIDKDDNSDNNYTVNKDNKPNQKEINMRFQSFSLTVRVISIVAFGLDTNHSITSYFFSQQMLKDMETIFRYSFESSLFPFPRLFWKLMNEKYQLELDAIKGADYFDGQCQNMINYKRDCQLNNPNYAITSMIDSMLTKELQGNDTALTDEEIIANVKTIYFAGSDTTSVVISWITYYFAIFPHFLLQAREEAKQILFKDKFLTRQQCIDEISKPDIVIQLTFCNACVKEILRLAGPASMNASQTADPEESVTLSNGLVIGPNDIAWVNNDGIHFNPEIFPQPYEFLPHRWLTSDPAHLQRMEESFLAFGHGSRICPGMFLASLEVPIAIAFLSYHFNIELNCSKDEVKRVRSLAACPNKVPVLLSFVNPLLK